PPTATGGGTTTPVGGPSSSSTSCTTSVATSSGAAQPPPNPLVCPPPTLALGAGGPLTPLPGPGTPTSAPEQTSGYSPFRAADILPGTLSNTVPAASRGPGRQAAASPEPRDRQHAHTGLPHRHDFGRTTNSFLL
ncbi:hypothetical protein CRUP_028227, partial [Coryphaenoides rupestris]